MEDKDKTIGQLINELAKLRHNIQQLEAAQEGSSLTPLVTEPLTSRDIHETLGLVKNGYHEPAINASKYHISELIDLSLIQQLFDSFFEMTGVMHALLDNDTNILSRIGWTDICLKFHRKCPQTECRCRQSDTYINDHLLEGPYIKYRCMNGLTEYATPIIVEGQHLATIYMGQLFNEPPDEKFFRRQAQEFGFDETAYLEALHKVNIIPEHRIIPIMQFYSKLGQVLATMGLERLRRIEATNQLVREREERLRITLETLRLTEQKFTKVFYCNADAMTISTLEDGFYLEVNEAFLKSLGYEEHEALSQTINELGIWVDPEERNRIIKQVRNYGRIENRETRLRRKSGEIKTVLFSAEIIEIGGEDQLLVSTRDITERKRMEEQLRLSEECFAKAFNASPALMVISTLEEGKYIKVNNAFCRITGYYREKLIGQSSLELGIWYDPADRYEVKQRIMANQLVQDMEISYCTSSGEQRSGLYSAQRLEIHGEPCMLSVLMDITELRKMEAEMTRLDRLNVVGEMAASIGHEIRNPMTTVRGYLQVLRENKDYSHEIEYFDLMIEELDRANSIITEFLSLAKNKIVELRLTSLNAIIEKLLPLVQAKAMSRDQRIRVELGDLPDLLLDIKEIRQLILNLVNNGMESMPLSGVITIRTFREGEIVVLAVQDQGNGIDIELLDKLGTPFLTTKEQGTGLGLAVCYRIAARHFAKIDIDTSSTGTTVNVRFPVQ